jgi:hydrogenase/urease accessory protein HupE
MKWNLRKVFVGALGLLLAHTAAAHPGHSHADVSQQVFQPWAGPDHLLAYLAFTALVLGVVWRIVRSRQAKRARELRGTLSPAAFQARQS